MSDEVSVRRLICDPLEVIERRRELRGNLIRSHPAPAMMAGPLS